MNKIDERIVKYIIDHVIEGTAFRTIQSRRPIDGIQYTNIRKEMRDAMAEYGDNIPDFKALAQVELDSLLKHARYDHPQLGSVLPLSNVEALFESPYNFEMGAFIEKYSQDALLFFHSRFYHAMDMIFFYAYLKDKKGYGVYSTAYLSTSDYRYEYIGPEKD